VNDDHRISDARIPGSDALGQTSTAVFAASARDQTPGPRRMTGQTAV